MREREGLFKVASSFIHGPRAETNGPTGDVMSSVIKTLPAVITHSHALTRTRVRAGEDFW